MQTIISKVNDAFKYGQNKWNFITDIENDIDIKLYIGFKECDLQRFKINGVEQRINVNSFNKTTIKKAILDKLSTYNFAVKETKTEKNETTYKDKV